MTRKLALNDAIDLLAEAQAMAEAAYLACGGMQMRQEGTAMQAVVGAYADINRQALEILNNLHEQERGK